MMSFIRLRHQQLVSNSLCAIVFIFLTISSNAVSAYSIKLPREIKKAQNSVLKIYVTKESGSSAVRISDDLVLSSAHTFRGYDGKGYFSKAYFKSNKKQHELRVVDIGDFNPHKRKMEDWVVLRSIEGAEPLSEYSIAKLSSKEEVSKALKNLGAFGKRRSGEPIWSITFPSFSLRMYPRPAPDGKNIFLSKGFLKTDDAYKKHTLFTVQKGQIFDEIYSSKNPGFHVDVGAEWDKLKKNWIAKSIHYLYAQYEKDGDPLIYHTADYSNGSSGGGFFLEDSGKLIGIVSMGTSPGSRRAAYYGIGQLYRIDKICSESKLLLRICKIGNLE